MLKYVFILSLTLARLSLGACLSSDNSARIAGENAVSQHITNTPDAFVFGLVRLLRTSTVTQVRIISTSTLKAYPCSSLPVHSFLLNVNPSCSHSSLTQPTITSTLHRAGEDALRHHFKTEATRGPPCAFRYPVS
jgi:hypothetical protein